MKKIKQYKYHCVCSVTHNWRKWVLNTLWYFLMFLCITVAVRDQRPVFFLALKKTQTKTKKTPPGQSLFLLNLFLIQTPSWGNRRMQQQIAEYQNNFFVEITNSFKTTSILLTAILTSQFPAGFSKMFAHLGVSLFTSTLKIKDLKSALIVLSFRHNLLLQKKSNQVPLHQKSKANCLYQYQSQVLLECFWM